MSAGQDDRAQTIAEREARRAGVDIEAVRRVEQGETGPIYRILETDAEEAVDQVGFQVEFPASAANAESMYESQLKKGYLALKRALPGYSAPEKDDTANDEEATTSDMSDEDPREQETGEPQMAEDPTASDDTSLGEMEDSRYDQPDKTVEVEVELSEESVDDLVGSVQQLEEVHAELTEMENRLDRLESMFNLPDEPDE